MRFAKDMATFALLGLGIVIVGAAASYLFLFRRPNPPLAPDTVRIGNAAFSVELATTTVEQARGLSYRASLGENDGMLFVFSRPGIQNFWMKDMNFPLDMIWIGRAAEAPAAPGTGGAVLGFAQNAEPQPGAALWNLKVYSSPDGTDKVLEVNAGTVAKDNIHIGDPVQIGGGGI